MKFQGCCAFPHGYCSTLSLLASIGFGLGATLYAVASCRFVFISFLSRWGDIAEVLGIEAEEGGDEYMEYKVSSGLYSWLTSEDARRFDPNSCTGFNQRMLRGLKEPFFDAARLIGVVAVLLSFMMVVWAFLLSSLSVGKVEIILMKMCFLILAALLGSTFLILMSSLCNDVGDDTACTIDEGGLVGIAAVILWFVCFLITCFFIKPPGEDLVLVDGELRSVFEDRQTERKRQAEIRKMQRELHREESKMEREQRRQEKEVAAEAGTSSKETHNYIFSKTPRTKKSQSQQTTPDTVFESVDEGSEGGGMEIVHLSDISKKL
mmetsp:Transcript_32789/g.49423  ORF Transcript_32789/g.49423 Transcript_32789/m.49423 type:complete len:321 (-) Transcript_32789:179-1141(-)|eukprot:CAMPEP_0178920786 /NCGR_PEP_ID=MMETSP0786-20121207/15193_1 /TAXON_ID=186022 /ORGANISM="Thalassionema frauenfeldii, Strain CCMP 1798" /LENGTH=320 /DNA_ID=CAMNT_0020594881 /DNA_START=79 /DNA_END=1041 /DNA_ORIENTATION=-